MPDITRSSIHRLGLRLRRSPEVAEADRLLYQEYREAHAPRLVQVRDLVQSAVPDGRIGSRLKTLEGTIAKLRREPSMGLERMQDIAGVRVTVRGLREQNDAVTKVTELADEA